MGLNRFNRGRQGTCTSAYDNATRTTPSLIPYNTRLRQCIESSQKRQLHRTIVTPTDPDLAACRTKQILIHRTRDTTGKVGIIQGWWQRRERTPTPIQTRPQASHPPTGGRHNPHSSHHDIMQLRCHASTPTHYSYD
jgi:hypothetical protein